MAVMTGPVSLADTNLRFTFPAIHLPQQVKFRSLTLGEVLDGDRMADSLYEINFKGAWHLTKQTMEQVWRVCLLSVAPSCQGNPAVSFCHAADCRTVDGAHHSSVCVHMLSWHSTSALLIHVPSSFSQFSPYSTHFINQLSPLPLLPLPSPSPLHYPLTLPHQRALTSNPFAL